MGPSITKIQLPPENVVLVLPDSHAHPDLDNNRYDALGNFIMELRPTCIINLGDFADMPSLSSYDKGKKSFEGKRYWKDVESTLDAQQRLFRPVQTYNNRRAKNRKASYNPVTVHTLGNHDDGRIQKTCDLHPELDGTISVKNLEYDKYWQHVIPFKEKCEVNGVLVTHYFTTGIKGMPIGGDNPARTMLLKNLQSGIQGHSHTWDLKRISKHDGSKMFGLVAGCYVHPQMVEHWNKDTSHLWDCGITVIRNMRDGTYDSLEFVSQDWIESGYT